MGDKRTRHTKAAAGQNVTRRAEREVVLPGGLPPDFFYTLMYGWNAQTKQFAALSSDDQSEFEWKNATGSLNTGTPMAMEYMRNQRETATDGVTTDYYVFVEVDPPNPDPAQWVFEVVPRPYQVDSTTKKQLCTVGYYENGSARMAVRGLATKT